MSEETSAAIVQKLKKSRPGARVVSGDGYKLLRDGEVYYPHLGETVTMVGEPSTTFTQDQLRFQSLAVLAVKEKAGMMTGPEADEFRVLIDRLRAELSAHVTAWTWTDYTGKRLGAPTEETLGKLPLTEFFFIVSEFVPEMSEQ